MLRPIARLAAVPLSVLAIGLSSPAAADSAPRGEPTILKCNFDTKPLDQIIGTGGAAVNEPVDLGLVDATVRALPFSTRSLQMIDDWGSNARRVRFQFLDDVEVTTGIVETTMTVFFKSLNAYSIYFREATTSAHSILSLEFESGGEILYRDLDTIATTRIGTYTAGDEISIRIRHDLDLNECTIFAGTARLLHEEPIGPRTRGIGSISIGLSHDVDAKGEMSLDDLIVTATSIPTAVDATSWGRLKTLWR